MKEDTPLGAIQIYFSLKIVFLIVGIILFLFNIPHLSWFNFLFEDASLYNYSIFIPVILLIGYLYCIWGLAIRSNLARVIAILLSFLNLFIIPIGTIISGAIIVYLVFFEKGIFEEMKRKNLPYRVTGVTVIGVAIIGIMFLTGALASVSEELGYGMPLTTAEKVNVQDTGTVEVIIEMKGIGMQAISVQNVVVQDIINVGGTIVSRTHLVANTVTAKINANKLNEIASNPNVKKIVLNEKIFRIVDLEGRQATQLLDNSYDIVNAELLWNRDITGDGIVVAVVDTGINGEILALQRNGQSVVIDSYEIYGDYVHWHGTAVASCIASQDSTYRGIAPGVDLLDVEVFLANGEAYISDILAGWEWIANWKILNDRFIIVSNSFGAPAYLDMGIISGAANRMTESYNLVMVCAAGNEGPNSGTISTPGIAEHVLTVGAVDDDLSIAYFSSRGPGNIISKKPDVVAPGHPVTMFDDGGSVITRSGTSFSTPITAGAVALVAQGHEGYSAKQFYNAFRRGSTDLGGSGFDHEYGYGLVNAEKSYDMIENELPEGSYFIIFGGLGLMGVGLVSYPEWRRRISI